MKTADSTASDCPFGQWDAAYVLGALPPDERRSYEDHLLVCAGCRSNVATLCGVPGLLAAAALELMTPSPEPTPVPEYAVFAHKVRRRRARMAGLATAAVLAVVVGTGAVAANVAAALREGEILGTSAGAPGTVRATVALQFLTPESGAPGHSALQVTGALIQQPWGTRLEWTCTYAANQATDDYRTEETAYEIVVLSRSGTQTVVGSWQAQPGDIVSPVAASSLPLADIAQVLIRVAGSTQPLLLATP